MPGWRVIKQGDRDSEESTAVYKVQALLRHRGFNLAADQIFGPVTAQKVREFQASKRLTVDGVVGEQTWPALIVTVALPDTGEAVKAVQSQFLELVRDGIFGPKTDNAVRTFQDWVHIAVDGIVGPVTWKAMVGSRVVDTPV
ncbi:MAG: peptidoglycan-binding domain-containing protein, partial [Acidimicrobiales bacterium]